MNALIAKMSPSIVTMIRMDHTHVMSTFHKYHAADSIARKEAIVQTVCLALEVHAQLEEEIFYPAMRAVAPTNEVLDKSVPEHNTMRELIEELRSMHADHADHAETFMRLMREVMHHVADEETTLLPLAESLLADRVHELGAQMTKRRLELLKPHAGEMARHGMRTMETSTMLLTAGGVLAGGYLLKRAMERRV